MRIWVDITDASHVVFFAPIVRRLEDAGHTVTITARRFAGADLVLRRYGLGGVLTTGHRGGSLGTRAVGLVNRTAQLLGSASSGRFDLAAGSPQLTFLDDERLRRGNAVNVRLVDEVAVPEAIPPAKLAALGAPPGKLFRYPGFKEEYYLHDFSPDARVLTSLGVDRRRVVGVVRPARPARGGGAPSKDEAALSDLVCELAGRRHVTLVLVARDAGQRARFLALGVPGLIAPDGPVLDGASLIAAADFVLGGGGVMAREAAALGTPAYTVSLEPPAAVDAALLAEGRQCRAASADDVELRKKGDARTALTTPRDPALFVDRLLELARRRSLPARPARDAGDAGSAPLI
jgi:predicted glycosyltransferase